MESVIVVIVVGVNDMRLKHDKQKYRGVCCMTEQCKEPIRASHGNFNGNLFCILEKGHDGFCHFEYPVHDKEEWE